MDSKDSNGADIPGERIFKDKILPDIVAWSATYTAVALTQDSLKKDFDIEANSIYKALRMKVDRELKDALQCKNDGKKIDKAGQVQKGRETSNRTDATRTEAILMFEQDYVVTPILYYNLGKDMVFRPFHGTPRTCQLRLYRGNCFDVVDKECAARTNGFCAESMYLDPPWGYFPERNEDKDVYTGDEIAALLKNAIAKNARKIFVVTVSCSVQQLSSYVAAIEKLDFIAGVHFGVWHKRGQQGRNIPADSGASLCRDLEPLIYVYVDASDKTRAKKPKEQPGHFPCWHMEYMKTHPTLSPQNMRFAYFPAGYIPQHQKYQVKKGNAPLETLNNAEKSQAFCSSLVSSF